MKRWPFLFCRLLENRREQMTRAILQAEKVYQLLSESAQGEERLKELAAEGLEQRVKELHNRYRRGEISFGRLAEELGLNAWELTHLLDELGLPATNLPSSDG
jgi:hypothetical protein